MKAQETLIVTKRRSLSNPENQIMPCSNIKSTEPGQNICFYLNSHPPETETQQTIKSCEISRQEIGISHTEASKLILNTVETKFALNEKQTCAFHIIALNFLNRCVIKKENVEPVHMLMTGPGGTGKTHTVKAVKEVMGYINVVTKSDS